MKLEYSKSPDFTCVECDEDCHWYFMFPNGSILSFCHEHILYLKHLILMSVDPLEDE